jgi:hypothetical protein
MSVSLSRRDALKGMMAASAAVAAMPYLASLAGTAQASPVQSVPVQATKAATAATTASPSILTSISTDVEPIILVIKNDVVRGFKGLQEVRVQDSGLASNLRSTMAGRFK